MDSPSSNAAEKLRILIIDDDELVRQALGRVLEIKGYDVTTATNGAEGLAAFHAAAVDIVITDIFMPAKDGLEIISQLRQTSPDVKIIAASGGGILDQDSVLDRARKIGADRCLFKPIASADLIETVRQLHG